MNHQATEPKTRMSKILVIDDEAGPRQSLRILLKNDYEVILADSVDEGIEALKREEPDVIVLDIRMPGKNGIEGLQEIRQVDPFVSVIMLTGFGALETAQEAIRHGANDYLKKPFDIHEIQETILRNVERSRVERRRARALDDLQELNRQLSEDVQEKEHMATLGQASAEFAHDIRNPLMVIMGYCQLLYDQVRAAHNAPGRDSDETAEYLDVIEKNVERCNEMAQTWQSFAKIDLTHSEPTSLSALLQEVVDGVKSLPRKDGRPEISYEVELSDVVVLTSRNHLYRVLNNIITNAIDAIEQNEGVIRVACRRENDKAVITITDSGVGMTPEQRENAFKPYFTTKQPGKGTGLGLYISRKIIDAHQGDLAIDSEPGKGTTLTIQLPVHEKENSEA